MLKNSSIFAAAKIVFTPGYIKRWVMVSILSLLGMLSSLILPYLMKVIVDEGIGKKNLSLFILLCFIAAGIVIAKYIFEAINSLMRKGLEEKMRLQLNRRVFRNIHAKPFEWFTYNAAGNTLYLIENDCAAVLSVLQNLLFGFIVSILKVITILIIILCIDLKLGLAVIAILPLTYILSRRQSQRLRDDCNDLANNSVDTFNFLEESCWRSYIIKVFNAAHDALRFYTRLVIKNLKLNLAISRKEAKASIIANGLPIIAAGAIYFLMGIETIRGMITLGSLAALGGYIYQLAIACGQCSNMVVDIMPNLISFDRLGPFLAEIDKIDDHQDALDIKGELVIRGLTFNYSEKSPVLSNISIHIPDGSLCVLTAPSGYGKTTLLNLILRLYPPKAGTITLGGMDLENINDRHLYEIITICPQEPMLWNTTIAKNIAYPNIRFDMDTIKRMAKISMADEFIEGLPYGYETMIGENGCRISQGQKQRIALARAIIRKPKVLLLDEAFSGLSLEVECKIIANIREFLPKITIVAATHRHAPWHDDAQAVDLRSGT